MILNAFSNFTAKSKNQIKSSESRASYNRIIRPRGMGVWYLVRTHPWPVYVHKRSGEIRIILVYWCTDRDEMTTNSLVMLSRAKKFVRTKENAKPAHRRCARRWSHMTVSCVEFFVYENRIRTRTLCSTSIKDRRVSRVVRVAGQHIFFPSQSAIPRRTRRVIISFARAFDVWSIQ